MYAVRRKQALGPQRQNGKPPLWQHRKGAGAGAAFLKRMAEELFCPILPILPFDSAAGAKEEILKRPTPLALYVFTRDARTAEEFSALPFGGGCINDTVSHLLPEGLPFGGAGESGLGSYHGYRGFFELSHFKSVLSRGGFELNMKYPPYGSDKTLRRFWK